jgi:hypothetical protein
MPAVTVTPDGRLVASSETIERLRVLCEQDARMLASGDASTTSGRHPRRSAVSPPAREIDARSADHDIDATLVELMAEVRIEAKRSLRLAREHTVPGGLIELRDVHIHQGARLVRAYAELVEAQARRRGITVEHRHQHLHRRVP